MYNISTVIFKFMFIFISVENLGIHGKDTNRGIEIEFC